MIEAWLQNAGKDVYTYNNLIFSDKLHGFASFRSGFSEETWLYTLALDLMQVSLNSQYLVFRANTVRNISLKNFALMSVEASD